MVSDQKPLAQEHFREGDRVHYHPIIDEPHDGSVYEITSLGVYADRPIAFLKGKTGWVALEALSPVRFYRVFIEKPACPHCNSGAQLGILFVDKDGEECGLSTTWGGPADDAAVREHVDDLCDELNDAYDKGRECQEQQS